MAAVIGNSAALVSLFQIIDRVADTGCTVLVTGESGTGKELVARGLHQSSKRATSPFAAVNCGAIPEALLESELFGHVKGAFTGAHTTKTGRLAYAEGGTLFLDEIGELSLALQVKLLRFLQLHEYTSVGDHRTMHADVRVVAATNIDLEAAVQTGAFREDLYYRLNVIHLHVPALRERALDIPLLAQRFLERASKNVGRPGLRFSPAAIELLVSWSWPGNVRELENAIERATILCPGDLIEPADLPAKVQGLGSGVHPNFSAALPDGGLELRAAVEAFENGLIRQALERTGWNKNRAARLLGLNRTTLVEMLKRKRLGTNAA
jgi:DNA-binding NtrC family response regulator